jgi:hypothetical protein
MRRGVDLHARGGLSSDIYEYDDPANNGPVWHSSASPVELFFLENNFMSNFMSRGELCFCCFTVCLTLCERERVFREADQRAGRLAIEVVKLLVKPLIKLYQTGPIICPLR